jgi:hypothetical protein
MKMARVSGFAGVTLLLAALLAVQANSQSVPAPIITDVRVDNTAMTLTINGFNLSDGVPTVTLAMTPLTVVSAAATSVVTNLPMLDPGTYLLALTSATDGAGGIFYLTVGAVGPQGPEGPPGLAMASSVTAAATGDRTLGPGDPGAGQRITQDHGGVDNTHVGSGALASVTSGEGNSAVGSNALGNLTTGFRNGAFGESALRNLTTGRFNNAFGATSLQSLTTGRSNFALGTGAMAQAIDASFNVAIGGSALRQNVSGTNTVAIGSSALRENLGTENIAIGASALHRNVNGSNNIAIGSQAGYDNLTGNRNVYIANAGADGESGVIRIGTEGVHTTTVLSGRVEGNIVAVYQ